MIDLFARRGRGGRYPSIADLIDASGDCWEWTGSKRQLGYGQVMYRGKAWPVHRLVWTALVGPIVDGLELDHLCRNESCCNPDHLEPVTHAENLRRGTINQYIRATHCVNGHPFSGVNLYLSPGGYRGCRQCNRDAGIRYLRRNGIGVSL